MKLTVLLVLAVSGYVAAQRITTIQLDGVQYFVSRMNPYSPELNYFLAYQYCRSLGLQLASFETREKADTMTQYLKNAGYTKYDFWTSGNKLGTDMFLWMSTGLPFNATFDYMLKRPGNRPADVPPGTEPQRVARESGDSGSADGCVAMMAPSLQWEAQDCTLVKDFICEQTRCYYYNYGSIPVSANQGNRRPYVTTTAAPAGSYKEEEDEDTSVSNETDSSVATTSSSEPAHSETSQDDSLSQQRHLPDELTTATHVNANVNKHTILPKDPVLSRLATVLPIMTARGDSESTKPVIIEKSSRPEHIPDIASLFADAPSRKENVFEGLETHEIRSLSRSSANSPVLKMEHREDAHEPTEEPEEPNSDLENAHTIGPYDTVQDYQNDQAEELGPPVKEQQDDDSSTILPEAEPAYRYNIKMRTNGKVLDPPSK